MEQSNKNSLHYNATRIDRFNDLCGWVVANSPISFVGYFKLFEDGRYLNLCNDLVWQEHFVNKIHHNGDNFQQATEMVPLVGNHKFLWPYRLDDPVFKDLFDFNIWHGLSIYTRGDNFIESWTFASKPENDQVNQLYINNVRTLEALATHAMGQDSDLFDTSDSSRLGRFKQKVNLYGENPSFAGFSIDNIPLLRGGIMDAKGNYIFLTTRELDTLRLLAQGKTAREAAEVLGLSQRTVESYVDNIKDKAGYRKKSEILDKFFRG